MTLTHERTADFFDGSRRERRQIITPEGVPVTVELADYGERLVALVIDLFIWLLLTLAIYVPIVWARASAWLACAWSIAPAGRCRRPPSSPATSRARSRCSFRWVCS